MKARTGRSISLLCWERSILLGLLISGHTPIHLDSHDGLGGHIIGVEMDMCLTNLDMGAY